LLPHQFEARKPEFLPQFGRTRSRIVSETPTDSSEEAFCITRPETKTKIDAKGRDLHNARIAVLALIKAPAFGQAVAPRCDTRCTAFARLGGVFEATALHGILAETSLLLWAASLTRSASSQSAKSRRSCASNLWLS
jgi:hypothetical protein